MPGLYENVDISKQQNNFAKKRKFRYNNDNLNKLGKLKIGSNYNENVKQETKICFTAVYCENRCWEQINPGMADWNGGTNM